MKLNIKKLLDFFDDKQDSQKGDANALIAIFGEDLNASAFKHFRKNKVEVLEENISQGLKKEKRLDRWILDKKENKLFQCEIKNWAATAIGGKSLKSDASIEETKNIVGYYWKRELNNNLSKKTEQPNGVTKVLLKMKPPEKYRNIPKTEPLLIYWMPISSDANRFSPLSVVSIKSLRLPSQLKTEFSKLYIFSVSLYLRQLYRNGEGKKLLT